MVMMNPYKVLKHPHVTEKSLSMMTGTPRQDLTDGNRLEFVVDMKATKPQIKEAFEVMFQAKVADVHTLVKRDGKHAIIRLKEKGKAEEIGMRIGVF